MSVLFRILSGPHFHFLLLENWAPAIKGKRSRSVCHWLLRRHNSPGLWSAEQDKGLIQEAPDCGLREMLPGLHESREDFSGGKMALKRLPGKIWDTLGKKNSVGKVKTVGMHKARWCNCAATPTGTQSVCLERERTGKMGWVQTSTGLGEQS